MSDEQCKLIYDSARKPPEKKVDGTPVIDKRWSFGSLQFEALMRMLDNAVC